MYFFYCMFIIYFSKIFLYKKTMKKVAMIGVIHQDGWEVLINKGYDVFEINNFSKDNLIKKLSDVDAIGLRTAAIDKDILIHCANLKIISRHGVGYNNVDLSYLNKHNQALAVTGTSNAVSVAEHVMTCFLYLTKNIHLSDKLTKNGRFKERASLPNFFELYEKNILICGFGRIGKLLQKDAWVLMLKFMFLILLSKIKILRIWAAYL